MSANRCLVTPSSCGFALLKELYQGVGDISDLELRTVEQSLCRSEDPSGSETSHNVYARPGWVGYMNLCAKRLLVAN